jgi:hypothetical protein
MTVSQAPPIVDGPWTAEPFVCVHGTELWAEPEGLQIMAWMAEHREKTG